MARQRKPTPPTNDPRIVELAKGVGRVIEARDMLPSHVAAQSGVDASHLGKWLAGTAGLGIEKILDVLQALGAQLVIHLAEEGDPRTIPLIGTMDKHGVVSLLGGSPTVPASILVSEDLPPFKKGDRGLVEPGAWAEGRWVLVAHPDGRCRLVKCEWRNGDRVLRGDELIFYEEEKHRIFGVAVARVEDLSE